MPRARILPAASPSWDPVAYMLGLWTYDLPIVRASYREVPDAHTDSTCRLIVELRENQLTPDQTLWSVLTRVPAYSLIRPYYPRSRLAADLAFEEECRWAGRRRYRCWSAL